VAGQADLTVAFTDASLGEIDSWAWDVTGNGQTDYTTQDCSHTFGSAYTGETIIPRLTVTNGGGSNFRDGAGPTKIVIDPDDIVPPGITDPAGQYIAYEFDENFSTTVGDTGDNGAAYDLTIDQEAAIQWGTNCLHLNGQVTLAGAAACTKVDTACSANDAIAIEIWLKTDNATQAGKRILSMGADKDNVNFALLQNGDQWQARLRTSTTLNDGLPGLATLAGTLTTNVTHLIFTWDGTTLISYEAGAQSASVAMGGDLSTWNATYYLRLGNEATGDVGWAGTLIRVCIYDNAISASDAATQYANEPGDYTLPTINPGGPVTAAFSVDTQTGGVATTFEFSDKSTGNPSAWLWNFGDGTSSTSRFPSKTYSAEGKYDVSLTVTGAGGKVDTLTEPDYIWVQTSVDLDAWFSANRTSGYAPLDVDFTDESTGAPTTWAWTFGDGGSSTESGPSHRFNDVGTYTVTLTVGDGATTDTETRPDFITVLKKQDDDIEVPPEPPEQPPWTHYVKPTGSDGASGTSVNNAWKTIARANRSDGLEAGDCLAIFPGTYDDYIEPANSGTRANPIFYTAYSGTVKLRGKSGTTKLVNLEQNFIYVYGLELAFRDEKLGSGANWWSWVDMTGQGCILYKCYIHRDKQWYQETGVLMNGPGNLVQECEITGLKISIKIKDKAKLCVVRYNYIHYMGFHGISLGIYPAYEIMGILIQSNTIENCYADGIQCVMPGPQNEGEESYTGTGGWGVIIRGNVLRYFSENAVDLKAARYCVVEDNVIYGCRGCSDSAMEDESQQKYMRAYGSITRGQGNSSQDIIIRRNLFFDTGQPTRFPGGGKRDEEDGGTAYHSGYGYKVYNNTMINPNRVHYPIKPYKVSGGSVPFSRWPTRKISSIGTVCHRQKASEADRCMFINNLCVNANSALVGCDINSDEGQWYDYNWYYHSDGTEVFAYTGGSTDTWDTYTFSQWQTKMGTESNIRGQEDHSTSGTDPELVTSNYWPVYPDNVEDDSLRWASQIFDQLDYRPRDGSDLIDNGGAIDIAQNSGSNSRKLTVIDACTFCDGYGVTDGDMIRIGTSNAAVEVVGINYSTNVLTLDEARTWTKNTDRIFMNYKGDAPDIGAYETDYGTA